MATSSQITTDKNIIKKWVEERGGIPTIVKGTGDGNGGLLRINFPNFGAEKSLEEISWDEFFRVFNDRKLAFLYQEKTSNGKESRFFKFVNRDGDRVESGSTTKNK